INFSEPVSVDSGAFTFECPAGTPISFSQSSSPAASYTLTPGSGLPAGSACQVKVIASKVHDLDTVDPPDNPTADFTLDFTTDAQPAVTTTVPADNATDVNENANITVNFSENVDVTASSFTLECPTGTPEAFSVSGSGTSAVTLDPTAALPFNTLCTVKAIASQISDS